jgi:hypothetical protein
MTTKADVVWDWWKEQSNAGGMGAWCSAVQSIAVIQTSSAAAERVFSVLNNLFGDDQKSALEDYVEGALMLAYNK